MILVVGGTGFIGKTLLFELADAGLEAVTVSRNPHKGFLAKHIPDATSIASPTLFRHPERFVPRLTGCVYLASAGRLGDNQSAPWREAERMLAPLMRMLHLVCRRDEGPLPVVYLSSAAVYGPQDAERIDETMAPGPVTAYGTGKAMAELAVASTGRQTGCPTRVLRPSTPIGRWQGGQSRGAVGAMMDAAESGGTFTVNGDGSAVRDYFDARDLARAIVAALGCDVPGHAVWNVGSGTGVSISELLGEVRTVTERGIDVAHRPMPSGEVSRSVLDIGRIGRDLEWTPKIPLQEALQDIWAARGV